MTREKGDSARLPRDGCMVRLGSRVCFLIAHVDACLTVSALWEPVSMASDSSVGGCLRIV
jgi:hypothetical protein